jgi:hypothetical protein
MMRHRWMAAVLPTVTPVLQFNKLGSSPFIFLKHDGLMMGRDGCSAYQDYAGKDKGCRLFEEEDLRSGQLSLQTPKKRRQRKKVVPLVENSERRFTRSCLNKEGYRPKPVLDMLPKIKKKSRAKLLLVRDAENDVEEQHSLHNEDAREEETDEAATDIPVTPLPVLQSVGIALGIAPEKLTKEQLEAEPVKGKSKHVDNV